jgi:phosphate/sulfate permease
MPFWLHKPILVRYVFFASRLHKILIFAGVFLLPIMLWFLVVELPRYIKLVKKSYEHHELIKQKVLFEKKLFQRRKIEAQYAALHQNLLSLTHGCDNVQKAVSLLLGTMRTIKISCRSIQPLESINHNNIAEHYLLVTGKARYHQLLQFIDACNRALPAARVTALTVMKKLDVVPEFRATVLLATPKDEV